MSDETKTEDVIEIEPSAEVKVEPRPSAPTSIEGNREHGGDFMVDVSDTADGRRRKLALSSVRAGMVVHAAGGPLRATRDARLLVKRGVWCVEVEADDGE